MNWDTSEKLTNKVLAAWKNGKLLRAYALEEDFPVIDVPLKGPTAKDLASNLNAAQDWATELVEGARESKHYSLTYGSLGGRNIGRTQIPRRAAISSFEQAWTLLRTKSHADRYKRLVNQTTDEDALTWALKNPLKSLELADQWEMILATLAWLRESTGSRKYIREISVPGVDTKFIERHRGALSSILEVSSSKRKFEAQLGLSTVPVRIHLRFNPHDFEGLPGSEVIIRLDDAENLAIAPSKVLIVENEITYLSVPIPPGCIVIWGHGFDVPRMGNLKWLGDVIYWGDLDTDGFGILNLLRSHVPQTRSVLMDTHTLLGARDKWVRDPNPSHKSLSQLTNAEYETYLALSENTYGENVRLEQERLDWGHVLKELDDAHWNVGQRLDSRVRDSKR